MESSIKQMKSHIQGLTNQDILVQYLPGKLTSMHYSKYFKHQKVNRCEQQ